MRAAIGLAFACAAVVGCDSEPQSAADCTNQIRYDGRVYSSYGHTDRDAISFGEAEEAECHDVGVGAAGSVFPDDPARVTTWSFAGYPTDEVLGVRFDEDTFAVYVADGLPRAKSDRIFRELGRAGAITDREIALAEAAVRQELEKKHHQDTILDSASVTAGTGRVAQSNTGHECRSGRLLRIRMIGTFPHIVTTGNPGMSGDDLVVHAVVLTADAESGRVCLIGVKTGQVDPARGATLLDID